MRLLLLGLGVLPAPAQHGEVLQLSQRLEKVVGSMCSSERSSESERQACSDAKRFQRALSESGSLLAPAAADPWRVLEGEALRKHPDPLGALQRGEVPAVMLRGFIPRAELDHILARMAQLVVRIFTCRFSATVSKEVFARRKTRQHRIISNESHCIELNKQSSVASLAWPHWCTLLAHLEHDCAQSGPAANTDECKALRAGHPVFDRCRYDIGRQRKTRFTRLRTDRVVRLAAKEFGQKLYGNLHADSKPRFMKGADAINQLHDIMGRGCTGRYCSPKQAMLAGVAELAGPRRITQQAKEQAGGIHSPGTVRAMTQGWATPLHMDSKHSSAFAALRGELCGEKVPLSMKTSPAEASRFEALTRHRFAASAILTMHAPNRGENPHDLNVFRTRWPGLVQNCSVKTVDAYGVGARFVRDTMPQHVLEQPLAVRADPGDLFLFNSEFFHDTPRIVGESARTVFNSFAGYSADGSPVEVYA